MSEAKSQLEEKTQPDLQQKALPETIPLRASQRFSLIAFNIEDARTKAEIRELEQQLAHRSELLARTQTARLSVLAEVEEDCALEPGALASAYQFNGQILIKAGG
jgi:hypothetical protein